ncbi:hypothetical protein FA09DRAFT_329434 [Tilletiopsis washingtonensis]|uniref:SAGA-associated factor 11 n=1 Tax=Tilletiopsis washingtonensis TaxID=58919 RepID=A0A316ZDR2_9BASI|nr:hypothetical protein FA09DRAFT_329434 [Tilletiopsis washingtonensis]PWN98373.1 hypothetical protein FA09DRAFT_329434 [Tilletiopsis washingtonensis]
MLGVAVGVVSGSKARRRRGAWRRRATPPPLHEPRAKLHGRMKPAFPPPRHPQRRRRNFDTRLAPAAARSACLIIVRPRRQSSCRDLTTPRRWPQLQQCAMAPRTPASRRPSSAPALEAKSSLTSKLLESLVHELIVECASGAHKAQRLREEAETLHGAGCTDCGTLCRASHLAVLNGVQPPALSGKDSLLPPEPSAASSSSSATSSAPKALAAYSDNPLLACVVCAREVSANRYSYHLSKCVFGASGAGGSKGARRKLGAAGAAASGGANAAAVKQAKKIASALEARRRAGGLGSRRNTPQPSDEEESRRGTPTPAQRPLIVLSKKRAGSPGFSSSAPASTTGAFKKARTNTPPPAAERDRGMVRSSSTQAISHTTAPLLGSPLNPSHKASASLDGRGRGRGRGRPRGSGRGGGRAGPSALGRATPETQETRDSEEEGELQDDDEEERSVSPVKAAADRLPRMRTETLSAQASPMLSDASVDGDASEDEADQATAAAAASDADDDDADDDDEPDASEDDDDDDDEDEEGAASSSGSPASGHGGAVLSNSDRESSAEIIQPIRRKGGAGTASSKATQGIVRSRGSDGEFIDVDSASAQSDDNESF